MTTKLAKPVTPFKIWVEKIQARLGVTNSEICEMVHLSPQYLYQLKTGIRRIGPDVRASLLGALPVTEEEREQLFRDTDYYYVHVGNVTVNSKESETLLKLFVKKIDNLSKAQQATILGILISSE